MESAQSSTNAVSNWRQLSLLATKLRAPLVTDALISRPRLIERLNEGLKHQLTLISAPAGFGKTTLLSDWHIHASRSGVPVGWVSLDKDDNDAVRFWSYLVAALETIHIVGEQSALALFHSPQMASTEAALTELINVVVAIAQDFVLVLDDYSEITAQPITDALAFLVDHLPANMHLFIASRVDPALPLARLRARNQLNEVGTAELCFTPVETSLFLNRLDFHLSSEDITLLETRTEGWVTGLQLAALSMRGRKDIPAFMRTFGGDHRTIADYLFAEVLDRQPPHTQAFLLYTAIPDRLSGSLCNALLEREDGQSMLEELEQANLFIVPLDDRRQWYRYHQLFRDFLLNRLQRTQPGITARLHRQASSWFERHDLPNEAIDHALMAADFEHAATMIEQIADALTRRRELHTLLRWLEAFPETQMQGRSRLALLYAGILATIGQTGAAEKLLQKIEQTPENAAELATTRAIIASMNVHLPQLIEQSDLAHAHMPEDRPQLQGVNALNQAMAHFLSGDIEATKQTFIEAGKLAMAADDLYLKQIASSQLAAVHLAQGKLHEAATAYQSVIALGAANQDKILDLGQAHIGLGGIEREWNNLEVADRYITEGIRQGERSGNTGIVLFGYLSLAQLRYAQGEIEDSRKLLDKVEQLLHEHTYPQLITSIVAGGWANQCLLQRDQVSAERWAQEYAVNMNEELQPLRFMEYLAYIRLLLSRNMFDEAETLLMRLQNMFEAMAQYGILINVLILRALTWQARGNNTQAIGVLAQALSFAEPGGYIRTFVDEGPRIAELLSMLLKAKQKGRLAEYTFTADYVRRLQLAFGSSEQSEEAKPNSATSLGKINGTRVQPLLAPLSERELEVLRLIIVGLSNQQIAQQLVVEKNTLKTHIKHLYRKLHVNSRSRAIARARELNLL